MLKLTINSLFSVNKKLFKVTSIIRALGKDVDTHYRFIRVKKEEEWYKNETGGNRQRTVYLPVLENEVIKEYKKSRVELNELFEKELLIDECDA